MRLSSLSIATAGALALAFSSRAPSAVASEIAFVEYVTAGECKLYVLDPSTQVPRELLDLSGEVFGQIKDPELSPSGHWLAFSSQQDYMSTPWDSDLWIMNRSGDQLCCVTHPTPGSFPEGSPTGTVEGTVYEDGVPKDGAAVYVSSLSTEVITDVNGNYSISDVPAGDQWVIAYDPIILYDAEDFGFMPVVVVNGVTSQADVSISFDMDERQGVSSPCWDQSGDNVLFIDESGGLYRISTLGQGLSEVVPKPDGVTYFTDADTRPATGEVASLTWVFYGNDDLQGLWICDPDGENMHQIVQDPYALQGLHWSPDGALLGYTSLVYDLQGQLVSGVPFYDPQGNWVGGIAMTQGWSCDFGGWDPSGEYACLVTWSDQLPENRTLVTLRLSDYTTGELYGPADVYCPSWGPEVGAMDGHHARPVKALLGPAYPNPTPGPVKVRLLRPSGGTQSPVSLSIYDLIGREVATVRGTQVISWDGCDFAGRRVPEGTYVLRVREVTGTSAGTRVIVER
jgi:hypothetical protein